MIINDLPSEPDADGAKYASGEIPIVGDVVELANNPCGEMTIGPITKFDSSTFVTAIWPTGARGQYLPSRFKLLRRASTATDAAGNATPQPIIAKPEQPPFAPKQFVRIKSSGTILNVARCEKRVVHGALRWVVDDLNGMRAFASDCELVQPETPPVRYACTKLAAVGDKVKVIGSNPPLHMNVEEISPTGGLYIKSPTGAWCMLLNSSQVEFVPEVTPLNGERATMFNPAAELEREQLRQQLAVAMSLLGQCDNRLFLVGDFEIRKAGGGWRIYCPPSKLALSADDVFEIFRDPVAAALRAKELSGVAKGGAA